MINNTLDSTRPTVTLNCSADGIPPPAIRWTRDGILVLHTPLKYEITEAAEPETIRISEISDIQQIRGELTIISVSEFDKGLYVCRADNTAGRAHVLETPFNVSVQTRKSKCDNFVYLFVMHSL